MSTPVSIPARKIEPHTSAPFIVRLKAAEAAENPLLEAASPLCDALENTPSDLDAEGAAQRHQWLKHEVRMFDRICAQLGLRPDHIEQARYTLAAALDEAARQQPWGREDAPGAGNTQWSEGIAVALGYGRQGGDQVYRLIERALRSPQEHGPLIDLFKRVLEAGFMGRYRHESGGHNQLGAIGATLSRAVDTGRPQPFPVARSTAVVSGLNGLRISSPVRLGATTAQRRRRLTVAGLVATVLVTGGLAWGVHQLASTTPSPAASATPLELLAQRLDTRFRNEIAGGTLTLAENPEHTALTLSFSDMFGPAEVAMRPWLKPLIAATGEEIASLPLEAQVAGHTDNLPSRRPGMSNRVLSQARADSVKTILLAAGVAPDRVKAVGRGDSDPLAENITEAGRAKNRRVEITVTPPITALSPPTPTSQPLALRR
ncbi:type IVB secretion system protein IcmH/DotU [Paraburkholderia adhaesiva]|uniref:type IVB secretion system protein IcmH/DotU n=1 Tax=Paraburkholderia adhaesiva TaxID=2883244 RepID=UPI001F26D239|nr:type IVB secretion system protein IcmH/DotU [Paraburkholderia adhaesiva]